MAVHCIVSEISGNWSKKPIFHSTFHLTCTITQNPIEFVSETLTQTARVLQNYCHEVQLSLDSLSRVHQRYRQTGGFATTLGAF